MARRSSSPSVCRRSAADVRQRHEARPRIFLVSYSRNAASVAHSAIGSGAHRPVVRIVRLVAGAAA